MRSRKFFGTIVRASVVHTKQDRLAPRSQSRDSRFPTEREPRPGRRPLTRDVIAPVRLPYLVPLFSITTRVASTPIAIYYCTRLHVAGPKPPGRAPQYNCSSRLKVVNLFSPHYSLQCYDAKFPETASSSKTCFVGIALDNSSVWLRTLFSAALRDSITWDERRTQRFGPSNDQRTRFWC
jgi:hypothetical protein